jgi:hypothetical protein
LDVSGGPELQLHAFLNLAMAMKDNLEYRKKAVTVPHMYTVTLTVEVGH